MSMSSSEELSEESLFWTFVKIWEWHGQIDKLDT